jgi:hypothetical protein
MGPSNVYGAHMQATGTAAFIAFVVLAIYGFSEASIGALFLAVAALGASVGAFAAHNSNQRRQQLDRIERNQG